MQVANMKKDSVALWYKDGREIKVNEKLDFSEGVLTLEITQVSSVSHTVIQTLKTWSAVYQVTNMASTSI